MAELLLKPGRRYPAMRVSRFSVKEICAIVSDMSTVADKHKTSHIGPTNEPADASMIKPTVQSRTQTSTQSESMRLNEQLRALLSKVSDKDKPAFEQFYDNTIALCYCQALRITNRNDIAEEVVSDVYMQVWNKAASYDEQRSGVMTWLMMLCRSRALDTLRQRKSQLTNESVDINAIAEPFTDENPQDILNAMQQGSDLHRAIDQLKPQQRQLLSLAYFRGLTHSEIADTTEIPLGTVKTQIRRAIIKLKELMHEPGLSDDDVSRGGEFL